MPYIQGLTVYTNDLKMHGDTIQRGKDAGLVLFVWGIEEHKEVDLLKESGLDGVIFDRYCAVTA